MLECSVFGVLRNAGLREEPIHAQHLPSLGGARQTHIAKFDGGSVVALGSRCCSCFFFDFVLFILIPEASSVGFARVALVADLGSTNGCGA